MLHRVTASVEKSDAKTMSVISVVVAMLLGVLVVIWVLVTDFPRLQDYPEWVYQGYIVSEMLKHSPAVSGRFDILDYPIPNSTSQLAIGLLALVLPPVSAGKMFLVFYCGGACWLAAKISFHCDSWRRGAVALVFLVVFAFNGSFWSGYINYQLAVLLMAFYVDAVFRDINRGLLFHVAFSLAIFFTHFAVFFVFVLLYSVVYLAPRMPGGGPAIRLLKLSLPTSRAFALFPALFLSGWYVVKRIISPAILVETSPDKEADSSVLSFLLYKAYTLMKTGPFQAFVLPDGGLLVPDHQGLYWAGVVVNGIFASGVVTHFALFLFGQNTGPGRTQAGPNLRGLVLLLCGLFLLSPQLLAGVVNIGERLIIVALLIIFLMAPPRGGLLWLYAATSVVCLPIYITFFVTQWQTEAVGSGVAAQWTPRYFTHRPYEFLAPIAFLQDPHTLPAPNLSFSTSVLSQSRGREPGAGAHRYPTPDAAKGGRPSH